MRSFDDMVSLAKLNELIEAKRADENLNKKVLWGLAIIGAVAAVVAIAAAVYKYLSPDYLDELDDFDDEFDDDFFDDEPDFAEAKAAKEEEDPASDDEEE